MTRINETSSELAREVAHRELLRPNAKRSDDLPISKVGDGIDASGPTLGRLDPSVQSSLRAAAAEVTQANPFESLLGAWCSQALPLRTVGAPLTLAEDASMPPELMVKLAQIEHGALARSAQSGDATPRLLSATDKVREAMMLTLSDGVGVYANDKTHVPKMVAAALGEGLYWETREAAAQTNTRSVLFAHQKSFPMGMNVEALVQAVLRESYLLQNEILKDYADRVKFYNEVKKKIRAKLDEARTLLSKKRDGDALPEDFEFEMYDENTWTRWEPKPDDVDSPDAAGSDGLGNEGGGDTIGNDGGATDDSSSDTAPEYSVVPGKEEVVAKHLQYGKSNDYAYFDAHRDALVDEILSRLPTDAWERDALADTWRKEGLELRMSLADSQGKKNWYFTNADGTFGHNRTGDEGRAYHPETMRRSDSLEEYVERLVTQQADSFRRHVEGIENEIGIEWMLYEIRLPHFTLEPQDSETQGTEGTRQAASLSTQLPEETDHAPYSKEEMDAYIESLDTQLNSVDGDAQVANLDLQNALQKQQQVLQMMSNVSKMLHDTAMSIIRKIGG